MLHLILKIIQHDRRLFLLVIFLFVLSSSFPPCSSKLIEREVLGRKVTGTYKLSGKDCKIQIVEGNRKLYFPDELEVKDDGRPISECGVPHGSKCNPRAKAQDDQCAGPALCSPLTANGVTDTFCTCEVVYPARYNAVCAANRDLPPDKQRQSGLFLTLMFRPYESGLVDEAYINKMEEIADVVDLLEFHMADFTEEFDITVIECPINKSRAIEPGVEFLGNLGNGPVDLGQLAQHLQAIKDTVLEWIKWQERTFCDYRYPVRCSNLGTCVLRTKDEVANKHNQLYNPLLPGMPQWKLEYGVGEICNFPDRWNPTFPRIYKYTVQYVGVCSPPSKCTGVAGGTHPDGTKKLKCVCDNGKTGPHCTDEEENEMEPPVQIMQRKCSSTHHDGLMRVIINMNKLDKRYYPIATLDNPCDYQATEDFVEARRYEEGTKTDPKNLAIEEAQRICLALKDLQERVIDWETGVFLQAPPKTICYTDRLMYCEKNTGLCACFENHERSKSKCVLGNGLKCGKSLSQDMDLHPVLGGVVDDARVECALGSPCTEGADGTSRCSNADKIHLHFSFSLLGLVILMAIKSCRIA